MNQAKPTEAVRKATSDGLQRIYLIIIGLAITHALKQTLTDQKGVFLGDTLLNRENCVNVLLLIAFLFTIIRFAHGSIIHLTALADQTKWQGDMFSLLLQAILFFVVSLTINKTSYFLTTFVLVLFIDSIWLLLLGLHNKIKIMEKNWLISNVIVIIILIIL